MEQELRELIDQYLIWRGKYAKGMSESTVDGAQQVWTALKTLLELVKGEEE
jgi:hypothetical protein